MIEPTLSTWVIAIFGAITFTPLLIAQLFMLIYPSSQKARDLIIGKNETWRDTSHFKYSLAFAWADWLIIFPLFLIGNIGVLTGHLWGYLLWMSLGIVSIYFSIIFWIMEKRYSLPSVGWLSYYTYFWGFFLYWGIGAVVYSLLQLLNK